MPRSKTDDEVLDVTDEFLNYDGGVTEAEGTTDNAEQNTSSTHTHHTHRTIDQQETDTSKIENQDEELSNEKENEDPEESAVQDQTKGNEKSDKEEEEEVYEVETVLDHNRKKNKTYYLIKWKGYSEEESTWEAEDNVFAEELVKEYWTNVNTEEAKQKETRKGRKRAAVASPVPTKKEKKARTTPKKPKASRVKIDEEFDHDEDWESLVSGVETVTRDDKTGDLLVYLKWKNGDTSRHPAREANIKCPQKMLKFYEQRLTFAAPQPKS